MSKAKFLSIGYEPGRALTIDHQRVKYFPNPLHYHKEFELAYILDGHGTRYVGSSIKSYAAGDLVLVGEQLPHVWKSDEIFHEDNNLYTEAIVVKFCSDFAGKDFLKIPEARGILKTLNDASGGLRIIGKTNQAIGNILVKMLKQSPLEQVMALMQILNLMSKTEEKGVLSNYDLHQSTNPKEKDRINRIIKHSTLNFKRTIPLEEIAGIANLSKSAFCRYFKHTVRKSYIEFLYDIRVEYACKLLLEGDLGMTQICYESGFNNPSSFSQIFKRIKGISPNKYRKQNLLIAS